MPAPQESPPQELEPQVSESRRPDPQRFGERPLLLYDGECGLCSRTVRFVLRRDRLKRLRFAALRSAAGEAALRAAGLQPEPLLST
ncbi:MAG: DCC1-like thiol-disulfide oxidoreductase family protein, partial [Planctomycetota bacterium]